MTTLAIEGLGKTYADGTEALRGMHMVAHSGEIVALLGASYLLPIGSVAFSTRAAESLFYALLYFSPIFCAGLLFGSAIKRSTSIARDYGTNLLGAMAGGVMEYLSLVTGYRALLLIVAALYLAALIARQRQAGIRPD